MSFPRISTRKTGFVAERHEEEIAWKDANIIFIFQRVTGGAVNRCTAGQVLNFFNTCSSWVEVSLWKTSQWVAQTQLFYYKCCQCHCHGIEHRHLLQFDVLDTTHNTQNSTACNQWLWCGHTDQHASCQAAVRPLHKHT